MKKLIMIVALAVMMPILGYAADKQAVLVIPANEVQDLELTATMNALVSAGIKVKLAAPSLASVKGMLGGSYSPDVAIADIDVQHTDLIAVIGGNGSIQLWENKPLISKTQVLAAQGKIVAAICAAPGVLANAGLLKGIPATSFPYEPIIKLLKDKGAQYIDQSVVVSGKIVTANGPDASVPFGKQLAKMLE